MAYIFINRKIIKSIKSIKIVIKLIRNGIGGMVDALP